MTSQHLDIDEKIHGAEHVEYGFNSPATGSVDDIENPGGVDEKKLLRKT
jgi:hypothetical protein